ncbi:hypothetical protein V6N13_127079 [Hibiscus sabdariffa]
MISFMHDRCRQWTRYQIPTEALQHGLQNLRGFKERSLNFGMLAMFHWSIAHRTYFFLLFKGDPKDYIYMEVEHKRLSFLKNAFTNGNQMVENGRVLTCASSEKALRRERQMLSQRMCKRLPQVEREKLFLKWGIELNANQRSLKLANLLWSDYKDMEHIAESAAIVAKLVSFVEPEKTFKEMFGLNFSPGQHTCAMQEFANRSTEINVQSLELVAFSNLGPADHIAELIIST